MLPSSGDAHRHPRGCLYCLRTDREFRRPEHVVTESLGSKDFAVIPRGVVCDTCNHGPLSMLDSTLANDKLIASLRVLIGVKGKDEKQPKVNLSNLHMRREGENVLVMVSQTPTTSDRSYETLEPGDKLRFSGIGHTITKQHMSRITRALWKIALGLYYLDHGIKAYDTALDGARAKILGTVPFSGWIVYRSRQRLIELPNLLRFVNDPQFKEDDGLDGLVHRASIFGWEALTFIGESQMSEGSALPSGWELVEFDAT